MSDDTDVFPAAPGVELSLGGLDQLLGFHLRLAHVAIYRDFAASMAQFDLNQMRFATLQLISANPAVSQVDLAATLGTDRATMMAMIDRLEQRGLVVRKRSTADRRRQELMLTPAGETMLKQAHAMILEHEKRFTERLAPGELEGLIAGLRGVHRQV
jgi:DNA-binding MarR family transcriptional regulator